jgi:putative addiction module component (TIGR02574 family)
MTQDEGRLLKEALRLPPEARAALAGSLLDRLEGPMDPQAESAWEAEIPMRVRELDSGTVTGIPWSEARRMIAGG